MSNDGNGTCAECGYDPASVSPADAVVAIRSFPRRYRAPLTRFLKGEDGDVVLRQRPDPTGWSALEYAAHVRDAFRFGAHILRRVFSEDRPFFADVDPDRVAMDMGYNTQDPTVVADELQQRAERLADVVEGAPADAWDRTAQFGRRGDVTALWVVRYAVHEGNHHLLDVGRVLRAVRQG